MTRHAIAIAVILALLAAAVPALAGTLAEEVAQAQNLAKAWKLTEAEQHCQAALAAATDQGLDKLVAADLLLLGDVYRLLTGLTYERALQAGTLTGDDVKRARAERRKVLGIRDLKVIGFGEKVDLAAALVPGKTNIVDFFSVYCGPCMALAPYLEAVVDNRTDLFLIKVDINRPGHEGIDWQSPAATQFKLQGIPFLRIYGPDGKLQAEGDPAREKITKMIQDAGIR
jgi:thiol-disulfide isomerase/thioredoxin